jgi:HEPN domain-containing protein
METEIKAVLESLLKLNKEIEGINYPGFHSNEPRELLSIYETEKQLTCALKSIDHILERFN